MATDSKFIADELYAPAAVARFVPNVCHEEPAQMSAACVGTLTEAFRARLEDKYTHANFSAVIHRCKGYPEECGDAHSFEVLVRKSQKQQADDQWTKSQVQADAEYNQKMAAAKAATAQAFADALQDFGTHVRSRTRCTATAANGTTETECEERVPNQ